MGHRGTILLGIAAIATLAAATGAAQRPLHHYVYFGLERERIRDSLFLATTAIAGAQLKFTWRALEPERGRYAFEALADDLAFLEGHGKALVVQIQDVSFEDGIVNVPAYLRDDPSFHGGAARQYEIAGDDESVATPGGWVARRWDPAVRHRFVLLLETLASRFDGRLAGITLPETAVEFGASGRLHPPGFDYPGYARAIAETMTAARAAFRRTWVLQYANFMPGEWLPWEDHGYLRGLYRHADSIGVGIGGPDLLPHRRAQQAHSYPLIAARAAVTVAGVAVQWGNLAARNPETGSRVTVAELVDFARKELRLDYLFWGTEEPYYTRDVLPYLRGLPPDDP